MPKLDPEHEALNRAYAISSRLASTFCSGELMRYLDVSLSRETEESFYDSMIVGADFSRMSDVEGKDVPCLELRILGAWHERGMVLTFQDVLHYSADRIMLVNAPDIHWIEFLEEDGDRRCRVHLTAIERFVEIGFRGLSFEVIRFGETRKGSHDFCVAGELRGREK